MKKLFTILSAVLLTFGLMAQNTGAGTFYMSLGNAYIPINQSNFFTGRSAGIGYGSEWVTGLTVDGDDDDDNGNDYWDKNSKSRTRNFSIGGQFGFFVANGLLTGVGVEYGTMSDYSYSEADWDGDGRDDEITSVSKYSSLAISPFVKYYIDLGSNSLFISSSYTFGTLNNSWDDEIEYTSSPDEDYDDESEPYKTARLDFGTGMAFFLTENISLEPSVNYAFNTYTQEREEYVGYNPNTGMDIYDDVERKTKTNAFYFKLTASLFL